MRVGGGVAGRRRASLQGGETARPGSIFLLENVRFGAPGALPRTLATYAPSRPSFLDPPGLVLDPKMRAGNLLARLLDPTLLYYSYGRPYGTSDPMGPERPSTPEGPTPVTELVAKLSEVERELRDLGRWVQTHLHRGTAIRNPLLYSPGSGCLTYSKGLINCSPPLIKRSLPSSDVSPDSPKLAQNSPDNTTRTAVQHLPGGYN